MVDLLFYGVSSLWLGILTSISPCPLATNIAAMSYISRKIEHPKLVFWTGIFYTFGRMITYLVLGVLIVSSMLSIPQLSFFLQKYMNQILGPVLIVTGMFLLELLSLNFGESRINQWVKTRAESWGLLGAGALGMVFALSFCPVSAALFFGSLIPLAIQFESGILLPSVYGVGTAIPVVVFAGMIAAGMYSLNRVFQKIIQIEWWARRITGVIFILIGIYFCLAHIFGVFS